MRITVRFWFILATMAYVAWVAVHFANDDSFNDKTIAAIAVALCITLIFIIAQLHRDNAILSIVMASVAVVGGFMAGVFILDRQSFLASLLVLVAFVLGFICSLDIEMVQWLRDRYYRQAPPLADCLPPSLDSMSDETDLDRDSTEVDAPTVS